jgi:hypothetical protein
MEGGVVAFVVDLVVGLDLVVGMWSDDGGDGKGGFCLVECLGGKMEGTADLVCCQSDGDG